VLGTHYHLLVRSLDGRISATMQRIQNEYVRWFNRTRDRDGPLFRGRFQSRIVTSEVYRRVLVRYIDENPCAARLARLPHEYPHCSAHSYVHRAGPPWLCRDWIEAFVSNCTGSAFSGVGYRQVFERALTTDERAHLERIIQTAASPQEWLEGPHISSSESMREWLRSRAEVADGAAVGIALCAPGSLSRALSEVGPDALDRHVNETCSREVVHAALLCELCGLTQIEVAGLLGVAKSSVSDARRTHRRRLIESELYARWIGAVAFAAARDGHPDPWMGLAAQARARSK
jgi:hypothetical protein